MNYPSKKERIIRIASHLFARIGGISEQRVDELIRDNLLAGLLHDPVLAPDHIRIGLVELGLLTRTPDGGLYRIDLIEFTSPDNIKSIFGGDVSLDKIESPNHLAKKIVAIGIKEGILV